MNDSIIPSLPPDDSRPSVPSSSASPTVQVPSADVEGTTDFAERSTPPHMNVSPSSTVDEEILPVSTVTQDSSPLKARSDAGSVEEHEVIELSH